MIGMQASVILDDVYVDKVQRHLQAKESQKVKGKWTVFGDGMPKLLDGEEFYQIVEVNEETMQQKAKAKEEKEHQRKAHSEELKQWKVVDDQREAHNKEQDAVYHTALRTWEHERNDAKAGKRKPCWLRPKQSEFGYEGPIPKPMPVSADVDDYDDEIDVDEDEELIWWLSDYWLSHW